MRFQAFVKHINIILKLIVGTAKTIHVFLFLEHIFTALFAFYDTVIRKLINISVDCVSVYIERC